MSTYQVFHSTLFSYCNDITTMREFYIEMLGLEETYFDDERGWLTCNSGQLNLVFIRANTPITEHSAWAKQPSYPDGTLEVPSWVITVDESAFDDIVAKIQASDLPTYKDNPTEPRPGHRAFWVRDPMGVSIELYSVSPSENAES